MKIQLEQQLPSCPRQLNCCVCGQNFTAPKIRSLLCNDAGLIQGDVCGHCLKVPASGIKRRIVARSISLQLQADQDEARWSSTDHRSSLQFRQQAFDLLLLSQENLTLPNFFTWLRKRWEILSEETRELETARFGRHETVGCRKRSGLRVVFEDETSQP
jgi:hypothetical protein